MMKRSISVAVAAVLVFFSASAFAQIASVERLGGSTNDPPAIAALPLDEDSLCFVDRTHEYNDVSSIVLGAQYVQVANDDKTVADYQLAVTMADAGILYLLIDNRVGDDDGATPPSLGAKMGWALALGFNSSGQSVGIDESGDGEINQRSTIYWRPVEAGEIVLLEQDDGGGRNMYGVAAKPIGSSPLPASSSLGLALLALAALAGGAFFLLRR